MVISLPKSIGQIVKTWNCTAEWLTADELSLDFPLPCLLSEIKMRAKKTNIQPFSSPASVSRSEAQYLAIGDTWQNEKKREAFVCPERSHTELTWSPSYLWPLFSILWAYLSRIQKPWNRQLSQELDKSFLELFHILCHNSLVLMGMPTTDIYIASFLHGLCRNYISCYIC